MLNQLSITKYIALVASLIKLHIFSIDVDNQNDNLDNVLDLNADFIHITLDESGFVLVETEEEIQDNLCKDLTGGRNHFNDIIY